MFRRKSPTVKSSKSLFRAALRHETLEQRNLMAVTSQLLSGGVLDIRMDASKDSAEVRVERGELTVRSDTSSSFELSRIQSIQVSTVSGTEQSITFLDSLEVSGALTINGLESVNFASGTYSFGTVSVVSTQSIDFRSFQLRAAGNVSLIARNTVTSTESGLLGFLGAVSQANSSIRLSDSGLFGVQIDVLAQTIINANADGDDDQDVNRDFARVKTVGSSEIVMLGDSTINATGNVRLNADTVQTVTATALAKPTSNDASRDAAVALTNVTSSSTITLGDRTTIITTGDLSVLANNTVTVTTTADGSLVGPTGKGGIVALAELTGSTLVSLNDSTILRANTITSKATSNSTINTSAKSTVGGATGNDASTSTDLANSDVNSSSGGLGLAAAYARTKTAQTTEVIVSGTVSLTASNNVLLDSDASTAATTVANAGATNNGGDASNGVGVAIALDRSTGSNRVSLAGTATIRAQKMIASANSSSGDVHTTTATSGVGAANFAGAGAFASNKLDTTTLASLTSEATLDAAATQLEFSASSQPTLNAEAKPTTTNDVAPKKGRGASIARNKLNNNTQATIANKAAVIGGGELNVIANSTENITTTSTTGSEGGNSLTAGVGMAVVDSNTIASIASGQDINLTGAANIQTTHLGNVTTTVDGTSVGQTAARGGSFALNDIDATVNSTVDRPLTASGNIDVGSKASGKIDANAKASVSGTGTNATTSDQQTASEQAAGGSDKQAPSADALGKVSAGAATAINLVDVKSLSQAKSGARLNSMGPSGAVTISSSNTTDSSASGDSSAVGAGTTTDGNTTGGTEKGRAVSVAINRATVSSEASAAATSTIAATNGISFDANSSVGEDIQRDFSADAISGAGSRKTGFAGSFALNRVDNATTSKANGAALNVGSGGLNIHSTNTASNTAKASPSIPATGSDRGVGASFALNIANNDTTSLVDSSSSIARGTGATGSPRSAILATSDQTVVTESKGGSGAEDSDSKRTLTSVFGIQAVKNTTTAQNSAAITNLVGSLEISADLTANHSLLAEGQSTGTEKSRGLVIAFDMGNNQTHSSASGLITTTDLVAVKSNAEITQSVNGKAAAKGGDVTPTAGGADKNVDDAKKLATDQGAADNGESEKSLETPEGSVAFAAALAVGIAKSSTTAELTDNARVTTSDSIVVSSTSQVNSTVKADATAVTVDAAEEEATTGTDESEDPDSDDARGRGVGVALSMNVNRVETKATVGNLARVQGSSLTVTAGSPSESKSSFVTESISGAGGGEVGTAGSLAIDVVTNTVDARIKAASIDVDAGALTVEASSLSDSSNTAKPSTNASGSKRGRGASVAINVTRNTTHAEIEDNAVVRDATTLTQAGAGDVSVKANSVHNTSTIAKGGAGAEEDTGEAAVTFVDALARVVNDTSARLSGSTTGRSHAAGNVAVTANHQGSTITSAEGDSRATKTAVGLVFEMDFVKDSANAEIAGNWDSDGNVDVAAVNSATSTGNAKASARGGEADKKSDELGKGEVSVKTSSSKNVLQKADDNQAVDEDTPDAETPDGSMSLAGAFALNVGRSVATAHVAGDADIQAEGSMQVRSKSQANITTVADASAVAIPAGENNDVQNGQNGGNNQPPTKPDPSQTGVGVAIALNVARVKAEAMVDGNATIRAAALTVDAGTDAAGESDHTFSAQSISGAGVDKIGFAGALTIQSVENDSLAAIRNGANVQLVASSNPDLAAVNQNLTVTSRNETSSMAKADASVAGSPTTGIGPSIVINASQNSSHAEVTGAIFTGQVQDFVLDASGDYLAHTRAETGATSKPTLQGEGGLAISPALAVGAHRTSTLAIAGEVTQSIDVATTGNFQVHATHNSTSISSAESIVNGSGNAAIGTPVAVNIARDEAQAIAAGQFEVGGDASIRALSEIDAIVGAEATQNGSRAGSGEAKTIQDRAQSWAQGFRREPGEPREKILDRLEDRLTEVGDKLTELSEAAMETTGVAAAGAANVVIGNTLAEISGMLNAVGNVEVIAQSDRDVAALADGMAVAPTNEDSYGGAIAVNIAEQTIEARAHNDNGLSGRQVSVRAGTEQDNTHTLKARALAGGGAKDDGVAGSISLNFADDKIEASIGKTPIENGQLTMNVTATSGISIEASSNLEVQNVAGAGAVGIQADGKGGALAVNFVRSDTNALTGPTTTLTSGGPLRILADSQINPTRGDLAGDPSALAAGGAGGGDQARAGAAAINIINETTRAEIGEGNVVNNSTVVGPRGVQLPGSVDVQASSHTELNTGAGAIALGLKLGRSVGVAVNFVNQDVTAQIGDGSSVTATGNVQVDASAVEDYFSIAAAPAFGGSVNKPNFGGAIQVLSQINSVESKIGDQTTVSAGGNVTVTSDNRVNVDAIAGAVAAAQNQSIGGSLNIVSLLDRTDASVGQAATINTAGAIGLTVTATGQENVLPIAVGGSGAGSNASAGSINFIHVDENTLAHIDDGATVNAKNVTSPGTTRPGIKVHAQNDLVQNSASGVIAGAGKQGIGGSLDAVLIDKTTRAYVGSGAQLDSDQNISVTADSTENILSVAASVGAAGNTSVMGALAGYSVDVTTQAVLGDNPTDDLTPTVAATAHARGSVLVHANDQNELDFVSGGAGVSGGTAVGGAASIASVHKRTEARIAELAEVNADGLGTIDAVLAKNGQFNISFSAGGFDTNRVAPPTIDGKDLDGDLVNDLTDASIAHPRIATANTESRRGVIVTATNVDDIAQIVAGAGIGGGFAVGMSTPATILRVDTTAEIGDSAKINSNNQTVAGTTQSVLVAAGNDLSQLTLSGALGASGAGAIAPAANIDSSKIITRAAIGDGAIVAAKQDVVVRANTTEDTLMITAAGSGSGSFGGSGSVAVFKMENQTQASIGAGADVDAGGNVVVLAADKSDLDNIAGSVGFGLVGGAGVSIGVNAIHKDTQAFIANDAKVDARANFSTVPVLSALDSSTNSITSSTTRGVIVQAYSSEELLNVAAAGAAGLGAGAGSLSVNVIDADTTAFIGDRAQINTTGGGAGAAQSVHVLAGNEVKGRSISGGLAVGAGSFAGAGDIGVVRNDTTTFIGEDAVIKANNDIVVHSLAAEDILSLGVSGGFAATGAFSAAASVWVLGSQFDATYSDDTTTTNALQNGESTVDREATGGAGTTRSGLMSSLNNYSGVTSAPVANPKPSQRLADLLRSNRTSVSSNVSTGSQLTADLFDSDDATGTTAAVRSGTVLNAVDDISVRADSAIDLSGLSGSTADAAGFAAGAAVTVERTQMKTDVLFKGTVDRADQVLIQSLSNNNTIGRGFSANGAIGGALGAVVTSVRDTSSTTARLDGDAAQPAMIEQASQLSVAARSTTTLEATTGQGAIAGVAAIGVTVTKAVADGTTGATIGDHVQVGQTVGESVGALLVDSTTNTHAKAQGTAIQAGIGVAGGLNFATAEATPSVIAALGSTTSNANSEVKVTGDVDVNAVSNSSSAADMFGLQLAGGAALGFSRAKAISSPTVEAAVGRATSIEADGEVTIDAIHNRPIVINLPGGGTFVNERAVVARAESAAGGAIAGNTARALAESKPQVIAKLYNDASIISPGLVHLASETNNNAQALGLGLTGGLLSVGGVQTDTTIQSSTSTDVTFGSDIAAGSLEVLSTSLDRGISSGRAASGGIIAGNGVTATADLVPRASFFAGRRQDIPTSAVNVSGATIDVAGNVNIKAKQQSDVDAFAKGIAVGLLSAGKSQADLTVKPLVDSLVTGSTITAGGNILIESRMGDATNPAVKAMDIEETDAVKADEVSTAFAKGSAGGLIGLVGSDATTVFKPIVDTSVRQSSLTATNVSIFSEDDSSAVAISRNFSAGLVALGKANATLDMKDDVSASVSGTSESGTTTINATNNFNLRSQSDQDGDAFSNTRAIAGFPTGRATTTIHGDYDLSASVGDFTDINAGGIIVILSEVEKAEFGSQQSTDPDDPTNFFGRPNFFGANANSDTGGLSADAFATATTLLGTSTIPAVAVTSMGAFSRLTAPTVELSADVRNVNLRADASAHSRGLTVDVSSISTGEVHSFARVTLGSDSEIDATTVSLNALDGSSSTGIRADVESTTDKDGIDLNPVAKGTIRMDTDATIDARDRARIDTRNLNVLADTNVSQFDLIVKENDTNRAGSGVRTSSFERDRSIHWNADLVLKGAASPTLIVEQDSTGNAVVTTANGVLIQDTDLTTIGQVAAPTIIVSPINNTASYGNVQLNIPRRGAAADDTGVIDGSQGSVTIERGFDEVNLINRSSKPMTVNNINVFNMTTPLIVVDAPESSVLSFPVFQNFGDTQINIENTIKTASPPVLTINGVINNPVGDTELVAGAIIRGGTGKIVTNTADIRSTTGNIGSNANRLPIELVVSNNRQEDLDVFSAGSISLDLIAKQRQTTGTPAPTIDISGISATTTNNVLLHTTVMENQYPTLLPLLRVNEIQEGDVSDVVAFFEEVEPIHSLDLGALGTGVTNPVASTWNLGTIKGSSITVALDPLQIEGPLMHLLGNTDVGSGNINVTTNGNIAFSETAGPLRIGAITTTRGDVTLNSANSIIVSPTDAAADVSGSVVSLNAATGIGTAAAPLDVDSGFRLNASAGGDIFLVETAGSINVGQISTSAGNVTLTASDGSIFDADADAAADIVGNNITLTANNAALSPAPTVGTSANALEVDSAATAAGGVRAIGRGQVNLIETTGGMTLLEARSATGNIRIDVPDTSAAGSDLTLNAAQVVASAGSVQLNAGDNLISTPATLVQGTLIGMVADFGNADPGLGSTVNLAGTFIGRPVTLATGDDADTVTLSQTSFQGQTNLALGAGSDVLTIDRLAPLTTTVNGVRDTLSVNLGSGAHHVTVNSSPTGNFIGTVTAARGTGLNQLTINDTASNDVVALNASQAAITRPGSGIVELLIFGSNFDRVNVNSTDGNDALTIDLAGGNLNFAAGVNFNGGNGTDQVTINGSAQADTFEVDATSATSGILRTQVANSAFSAPITLTSIEQVGFNGQNPTTSPGDRLIVRDSLSSVPSLPSGSLITPLPVAYTNIEHVAIGDIPLLLNDQFTIQEDSVGTFNLFANDTGLTDLPLTVTLAQPSLGTVVYNNGGTPSLITDDRFVFTPPVNVSGVTSFQYTVIDANGDQSTATVQVTISRVVDPPIVTAENVGGDEGQPIQLNLKAQLVDTDGSESLSVRLFGVPAIAELVDSRGLPVGINRGDGVWDLTGVDLANLFMIARDNGSFDVTLEATSTEALQFATRSASFVVNVGNIAPAATIMSAPTDADKDSTVSLRMAATDPSEIDKASGFTYRIDWGDGSDIQVVQGQPGVPPTVDHIYTSDGIYTITITAADKDGAIGRSTSHVIRIGQSGIVDDPLNPGKTMLVLQGTEGNDELRIERQGNEASGQLLVYNNGLLENTYPIPTSRIMVNALGGDDSVLVEQNVKTNAWLLGGLGNDILIGGGGDNLLLGGDGNDHLLSRQGQDILFGGLGEDQLDGGSGENILLAGTSIYDLSDAALYDIQREWLGTAPIEIRIDHLRGVQTGGANGNKILVGSGANQTAFDDHAEDRLENHRNNDWILANTDQAILDVVNEYVYLEELDGVSNSRSTSPRLIHAEPSAFDYDFDYDVDRNGSITPLDVLLIINRLNQADILQEDLNPDHLLDVSGDSLVSPLDVLLVINRLNEDVAIHEEGESPFASFESGQVDVTAFEFQKERRRW